MRTNRVSTIHILPDRVNVIVPGELRLFRKDLADKAVAFTWQEVSRVIAFKRDQWIVDRICLVFELNGTETMEVNEEMEGWTALVNAVPVYLSGALAQEEWWSKVAFPAFQTCLTEIYPRV
jgi:hypothetical protein